MFDVNDEQHEGSDGFHDGILLAMPMVSFVSQATAAMAARL